MDPPPPKRLKGKEPPSHPDAMILCSKCQQVDVGPSQPSFFVECSTTCQICAHCFSEVMSSRTQALFFCCPTCNEPRCQSWTCETTISRTSRRGTNTTVSQVHKGRINSTVDLELDAPRFFEKNYSSRDHDGYVSLSFLSNRQGEVAVESAIYKVTDDCCKLGSRSGTFA
jgi:hypothetical protein